jgi:glucose/mannose-6-phosphate isomerase
MNLNDRATLTELDPKEMLRHTEEFPDQCRKALAIAQQAEVPNTEGHPGLLVLAGMGGSAAGGDFVRALFEDHGGAPFLVVRDYTLPNFVGVGDVVFCASYSGNTEETLAVYEQAKTSGAKIVAITSGGKLADLARQDGHPVCIVPGNQPPRTALGYMMIPVLYLASKLKVLAEPDFESAFKVLEEVAQAYGPSTPDNEAMRLAQELHGKFPVLYGLGTWQGLIANRWKGQFNENAKQLALVNAYPELNHNEILGWVQAGRLGVNQYAGVLLEDGTETERMQLRSQVTERLIGDLAPFTRVQARGETLLERMLSLAYIGDFVSLYLARLNGVDPENIDSINVLKDELGKLK